MVRPPAPPAAVARLVRDLGVPPLVAALLWGRGLSESSLAHLEPPLAPTAIPDMGAAAERLEEAVRTQRPILVHGDYDADGVCGTAVLTLGLRALGADVRHYIPNRLTDGYGICPARVADHITRAGLFVTVDCGISNLDEIAALQQAGVEVIVTDHHQPSERLPDCLIVHPALSVGATQGLPQLTGAGLAFHLLWAVHERLGIEAPLEYADIAAIGTIADVAPLLGENRALVQAGLERLRDSRWPGLRACVAQSRLRREITARDVAFVLAPRLNAAGRLGEADKALELLITPSERRALELAAYLDARNQDRRKIQDEMLDQALAATDPAAPALVLADDRWHPGLMGIVAAKLLERFYKPVFIVARGKGSVRSPTGISAVGALRSAAAHLERFGGHAQAAGFAISPTALPAFAEAINEYVSNFPSPVPALEVDLVMNGAQVDAEFYRALQQLEPFGEGHPPPLLALCDRLEMARAVGRDRSTLQLRIGGVRGVAWRKGELATSLRAGQLVNGAVSLREHEWQGKRELEFVAEDLRPLEPLKLSGGERLACASDRSAPTSEAHASEVCTNMASTSEARISNLPSSGAENRTATIGVGTIRRGPAPASTPLLSLDGLPHELASYWLKRLPLGPDPLDPLAGLRSLLAAGATVYLDLDEAALMEAEGIAATLPTVAESRKAFLALRRGAKVPFSGEKLRLVQQALAELDLVDPMGRVRSGAKRDPHSSPTLLRSLVERYRLQSFVNAYRAYDDNGFAHAATILLEPDTN